MSELVQCIEHEYELQSFDNKNAILKCKDCGKKELFRLVKSNNNEARSEAAANNES